MIAGIPVRAVWLPFLLLLLAACDSTRAPVYTDEQIRSVLLGTWYGEYDLGDEIILHGEKTYNPDGTSSGILSTRIKLPSGNYQEVENITFTAEWRIEEGVVISENAVYSSDEYGLEGNIARDLVVHLEENKIGFVDIQDGSSFERFRKVAE